LVTALSDLYPGSVHVTEVGLAATRDLGIWAYAAANGFTLVATPEEELESTILAEMEKRGRLPNLSTFAFTATPKPKTLELFGTRRADGKFAPFHLYRAAGTVNLSPGSAREYLRTRFPESTRERDTDGPA
jgi:hypothetical protein